MAWDDEVEYFNQQGDVRHADGEEYAGLYAVYLPEGYRFQWHVWRESDGPNRRYRVVLDLFTPWDAIDWDPGYRWVSKQAPRIWAERAVRILASDVRGYIEEHGSDPGVHEVLDEALEGGLDRTLGHPAGQGPSKRKQDWSPRQAGSGTRRKYGER